MQYLFIKVPLSDQPAFVTAAADSKRPSAVPPPHPGCSRAATPTHNPPADRTPSWGPRSYWWQPPCTTASAERRRWVVAAAALERITHRRAAAVRPACSTADCSGTGLGHCVQGECKTQNPEPEPKVLRIGWYSIPQQLVLEVPRLLTFVRHACIGRHHWLEISRRDTHQSVRNRICVHGRGELHTELTSELILDTSGGSSATAQESPRRRWRWEGW